MSNKVTVIGFQNSGKTTYLTGMYIHMSTGIKHFSLLAKDGNLDLFLENNWEEMCDGKMPLATSDSEKYEFHIAHNYKPVCDFEWLDYPGGILANRSDSRYQELMENIKESDCLLLLLDGEVFSKIEAENFENYKEKLIKKFNIDKGLRQATKIFTALSNEGISLPPIGIVVTKCDLFEKEYQEAVREAIREKYEALFEESERVVLVMSVSLGDFSGGDDTFDPDPFYIEQPIAFAVLAILLKYISALQMSKNGNSNFIRKQSAISGVINRKKVKQARQNLEKLNQAVDKWSADAYKLIELFPERKIIYVGGTEKNMREYYRELFANLS